MSDSPLAKGPTDAEIETLIRDAHAGRLDPEDSDKAKARLAYFCFSYHAPAKEILIAWQASEPNYEWSPERLEEAFDLGEIDLAEDRVAELIAGAAPTDEEQAYLRQAAEAEAEWNLYTGEVGRIYRLSSPEGASETRAVFFLWTGMEFCQYSETHTCIGPLCHKDDASSLLDELVTGPCEYIFKEELS